MPSDSDAQPILVVIPARGGSKGIPGKNLREVAGRPLIEWSIGHALEIPGDVRVVVSTDDEEIARVARAAGAEVPFMRPPELAVDTAPTEPAVAHAIEQMELLGFEPFGVVLLQATSPVRLDGTVARAVDRFRRVAPSGAVDCLVGVVPQTPFAWHMEEPPRAEYDVQDRPRRQDLTDGEFLYRETGSLYVTRTGLYASPGNRIAGSVELFVMDEIEGVDIDSELELRYADLVLRERFGLGT